MDSLWTAYGNLKDLATHMRARNSFSTGKHIFHQIQLMTQGRVIVFVFFRGAFVASLWTDHGNAWDLATFMLARNSFTTRTHLLITCHMQLKKQGGCMS